MSFLIKYCLYHYRLFLDVGNNVYQRVSAPYYKWGIKQTLSTVTRAALQCLSPVPKASDRFS